MMNSIYHNDQGFVDFEGNFLTTVSLVGFIISFVGLIANFFMKLPYSLLLIPFVAMSFYFTLYLLSKKHIIEKSLRWFLSIGTMLIINLLWYYNFGFRGPAPYFFVIIYGMLIYVWHEKELSIVTFLMIINVLLIFYLDYNYPELTKSYANQKSKVIDIYFGVFFYIGLSFLVIFRAKKSYVGEYRKAKEAEMLKSSFLANMSHEIRTPLNAIVGFSNLLAEPDLSSDKRTEYKRLVEDNNEYLLQLINDILDISKIESKQLKLTYEPVSINHLLKNIYNSMTVSQKRKQIESVNFNIEYFPKDFTIETNEVRVTQILLNLISNAFKFTNDGEINVKIQISERFVVFEISDTGIGIREENIEKIFERFYRIDNNISVNKDKSLYRGTGLGLYLSRNLANLLGGNLWALSTKDVGSVFYLSIPIKNYTELPEESTATESTKKSLQVSKYSHLKIMVVEDDKFNQIYFVELFKRFKIKITLAKSGEEAVEILKEDCGFDLLFLDIKLPGIDGFEVLTKAKELNCKSFIVAQTANAMEGDREKCLNTGFDVYISKPIKKAAIQKVLDDYLIL